MTSVLVGRDHELVDLAARVRTRRLVTIVGPGGVGKTALATAVAARVAAELPAGAAAIDLATVSDPSAVPGAIASQLGFDSFDAVLASPADGRGLLLVDNCEHVLDDAADAVARMLGAAHELCILATSRTPLDLPAESVLSLAPLGVPAAGGDPRTSPSVLLFRQRCRDAGFDVVDGDIDTVAALCRRLDGLPLAIELAAARTRSMSVAEIATRLDTTMAVLDRPQFRGDARHRSVASTISWSYDLLSTGSARLLDHLGVFGGLFAASAARAVAPEPERFDEQLDDLVHSSLVVADTTGTEARYRLLATVRRFALDRLDQRGATRDAYDRFVDHIVIRSIELVAALFQPWRAGLMHDLVAAYDDLAEALRWCIANDETPRRAYRLCLPFVAIVHQGHADEITDLMRRLIVRFPQQGIGGAQARAVLATGEYVTGEYRRGVELATSTLDQHPGPDASTVGLYRVLGRAQHALGDYEASIAAFREGARIGRALGIVDLSQELEAGAALGEADAGRTQRGLAEVTAIIEPARAAGSVTNASWAATVRAWILVRVNPAMALEEAGNALAEAQAIDFPLAVAIGYRTRAYAHLLLGDVGSAARAGLDLLDDLSERGALSNLRIGVDVAAALAAGQGHPQWQRLAATARALPITTPACSQFEVVPVPAVRQRPLARHEVIAVVRSTLDTLLASSPQTGDPTAPAIGSMRARGALWDIEFDGTRVSLRASKGLSYLAHLVARPGTEIRCTDLVLATRGESGVHDLEVDGLDSRIRTLRARIHRAHDDDDYRLSYLLQVELDAATEQLAARGQAAPTPQESERARTTVTHALRSSVRHVEGVHPSLGRHLHAAVRTGTFCSYRPERPVAWIVDHGGSESR